ncbi:hypothetical protein KFE25_000430 [Diacronema lutheri]|uniref:Bidirectional sugar transporter SWEET n=2 Tax=Diacronema lutheri TaxID=2081491 RepID=A0A8J5XNS3_DIALT|nr:hypothetical protein KFE25_000430 [Diacronema lutheri]
MPDASYYIAHHVAPAAGSVLAQLLFLSPRSEVLAAKERGSLGSLNPWPFVFIVLNCTGWLVYAVELRDWYVFASNLPGLLIGLWYVMQCLPLMPNPNERARIEWATLLSIGVWVTVGEVRALAFARVDGAGSVFAWMTIVGLVMFYASPLATIAQVVRQRDSSSILPQLAILSVINGLAWTAYGYFAVHNFFIAGPNFAGVCLALVQLGVRAAFPAKEDGLSMPKPYEPSGHIALVPVAGTGAADGVFQLERGELGRFADGIAASKSTHDLLPSSLGVTSTSRPGVEDGNGSILASSSDVELMHAEPKAGAGEQALGGGLLPASTSDGSLEYGSIEASSSRANLLGLAARS